MILYDGIFWIWYWPSWDSVISGGDGSKVVCIMLELLFLLMACLPRSSRFQEVFVKETRYLLFLFILAMEGLHAIIEKAKSVNLFTGVEVRTTRLRISHLLYADDVIFMGEWSFQNAVNLIGLLRCFYVMSGLKINVRKSNIYGIGVEEDACRGMAAVLGCGMATIPFKYLGVLVGCDMSKIGNWNDVVEKFKVKLSNWRAGILSVGGRLTLIKSVLSNLPIYYMSIYKMPIAVEKI